MIETKATKSAASYDKQRGKIVGVLAAHYKVELLTGPAKGEVKKYTKPCVDGLPSGGASGSGASGSGAPAGALRSFLCGGAPNASGDAAANTGGGGTAKLACYRRPAANTGGGREAMLACQWRR